MSYTSTDCTFDSAGVFTAPGACNITASATVQGAVIETTFSIEIVAGAAVSLTLTPSVMVVPQGGAVDFTVTAVDIAGNRSTPPPPPPR